ncbi:hypothetical protein [Glaciecola sp. SC05]|uniref:hypothetical protein n=1 Tax=Glaciecola sp. SC05 TaxID=1987355 RepID=UPI0035281614
MKRQLCSIDQILLRLKCAVIGTEFYYHFSNLQNLTNKKQNPLSVIACIIDSHVIQKILEHLDKKYPTSSQTTLLPPLRAPPDEQRDFNFGA